MSIQENRDRYNEAKNNAIAIFEYKIEGYHPKKSIKDFLTVTIKNTNILIPVFTSMANKTLEMGAVMADVIELAMLISIYEKTIKEEPDNIIPESEKALYKTLDEFVFDNSEKGKDTNYSVANSTFGAVAVPRLIDENRFTINVASETSSALTASVFKYLLLTNEDFANIIKGVTVINSLSRMNNEQSDVIKTKIKTMGGVEDNCDCPDCIERRARMAAKAEEN